MRDRAAEKTALTSSKKIPGDFDITNDAPGLYDRRGAGDEGVVSQITVKRGSDHFGRLVFPRLFWATLQA